ncbi:MAG: hypothetical protein OEM23_00435 [Gemmatimonadota bacterium]|nr:hypothetical protein [Gemmatimonadota bacterium]
MQTRHRQPYDSIRDCDTGHRCMSKVCNEVWLREQGLMEPAA